MAQQRVGSDDNIKVHSDLQVDAGVDLGLISSIQYEQQQRQQVIVARKALTAHIIKRVN